MAENLKLAKALREAKSFLQGASNAAASNVSAPVDAIVFPGNEGLLTILERNGQLLGTK